MHTMERGLVVAGPATGLAHLAVRRPCAITRSTGIQTTLRTNL